MNECNCLTNMALSDHRKKLIDEYKQQPKRMGAYCIRNTQNERCFVGVSRDIDARINRHRFELRMNSERQVAELQADWNEYGAECFEFSTLEEVEPLDEPGYDPTDDLLVLEGLWLDQLQSFSPKGYNRQRRPK